MDYSFLSFTLDIWLILHIIIILFYMPPSKCSPVSKLHSAVTYLSFKKERCLCQSSANIVKKEMGKNIFQVFLWSGIIMTYQSLLVLANWCLLSMYNPSVWPSRSGSKAMGGGEDGYQIVLYRGGDKWGMRECFPLCPWEHKSSCWGCWKLRMLVVPQILA